MILFWRKKPWVDLQHEEDFIPKNYSERGVETGAKLEDQLVGNVDLERIFYATESMDLKASMAWLEKHQEEFDESTFIVNTDDGNALDALKGHHPRLIINKMGLTRIRHLNTFLNKANEALGQVPVCVPLPLAPDFRPFEADPLVLHVGDEGQEPQLPARGTAGTDV